MKTVRYLGHIVGEGVVRTDPYKISAMTLFVPNRSRHFRVTPRDKGVMSTCRWHGDALLAGRSRRGNGNEGYCDAGPQAMRSCADGELTWSAASGDSVLRARFPEVGSRTAEL